MAVKTVSRPKDVSSSKITPRAGTAGTGACFLLNPQGSMVFRVAAPASSAYDAVASGLLKEGDVLIKVDGEDVQGRHISELAGKLLGHPRTTVKLTFRRGIETIVNITLERRFP
jgi:C-terminal processing protease CtpA/Prc